MALHSLYCADVPLRNCSLTQSSQLLAYTRVLLQIRTVNAGWVGNFQTVSSLWSFMCWCAVKKLLTHSSVEMLCFSDNL